MIPSDRSHEEEGDPFGSFGRDRQGGGGGWDGGDRQSGGGGWDGPDRQDGGDMADACWPAGRPAARRPSDVWILVGGGIAAAAAFAAAFIASGGTVSHPAAPAATVHAVVSQACPSPAR